MLKIFYKWPFILFILYICEKEKKFIKDFKMEFLKFHKLYNFHLNKKIIIVLQHNLKRVYTFTYTSIFHYDKRNVVYRLTRYILKRRGSFNVCK